MEPVSAGGALVTVAVTEIDDMKQQIRQQKGQLALALTVLVSLGFDLGDFISLM